MVDYPDIIKVGDKILIRKLSYKGDGGGETTISGKVKGFNSEGITVIQPDGKKMDIAWEEIIKVQIVYSKISIFKEVLGWVVALIFGLVLALIFAGMWVSAWIEGKKASMGKRRENGRD